MNFKDHAVAFIRQKILYPEEFQIPAPEFGEDQLVLLEELIQLMMPTVAQAESAHRQEKRTLATFLAELGTGVWRVRNKVDTIKRMPKELRDALFSLESTWESMTQGGVDIADHMGELPVGMVPRVIEVREVPGLDREQVIETLKPTITLRGEVMQIGEVIVGRPAPMPVVRPVPEMIAPETLQELKAPVATPQTLKTESPEPPQEPAPTEPEEAKSPAEDVQAAGDMVDNKAVNAGEKITDEIKNPPPQQGGDA